VDLTPTEFDILALLARNANLVVTKKRALEYVCGPWAEDADTLRVHMCRLRKKLEPSPAAPRCLGTEPRVGYQVPSSGALKSGRRELAHSAGGTRRRL